MPPRLDHLSCAGGGTQGLVFFKASQVILYDVRNQNSNFLVQAGGRRRRGRQRMRWLGGINRLDSHEFE